MVEETTLDEQSSPIAPPVDTPCSHSLDVLFQVNLALPCRGVLRRRKVCLALKTAALPAGAAARGEGARRPRG